MSEIRLTFNLAEIMDREGITKYRLHKETGIRANTMTAYYNAESKRIDIENLERIINAINRISGKDYTLSDIIKTERTE